MYEKNRSGQWLYFGMVSALSGNPVASIASGNISGRVSLDGGAQAVAAGPINEVGGGQYVLGMYAGDINGRIAGFFFTASGCVPVSFTVITSENVSGRISPNSGLAVGILSGQTVGVYSGNMSGQLVTAASGVFATASLNSGQFATPYSGSLSGQKVELFSGNVVTSLSGTTWLNPGQQVGIQSGTIGPNTYASGRIPLQPVLSGRNLAVTLSGNAGIDWGNIENKTATVNLAATSIDSVGTITGDVIVTEIAAGGINDGSFLAGAITTAAFASGAIAGNASGLFVNASLNSGQPVLVYSGQLSGQFMTPQSGTVFPASGLISQEIPQATLTWNFSGAPDVSGIRCQLNAERKLINKWSLTDVSGYLRVYREDDSTAAYDQAVGSTSGALPVTSLDT